MSQVDNSHEHASAPQAQHTNFTLAFQDGRRGHDERGIGYTIRVRHLGDLAVTSGQIVACDPFWLDMAPQPFMTTVPLGHHPVLVSVVSFAGRDQRVACAMVRFASGEAVRWELALRPDWDAQTLAPGELVGYPVDAGMGCFMDYTTMEALLEEAGITDVDD